MDLPENNKDPLSLEKLRLEIRNLKRPYYSSSFYSAISAILVALIAIILSFSNGLFEKNSRILELRKENLQFQINNFQIEKDSLYNANKILRDKSDSLNSLIVNKNNELLNKRREIHEMQLKLEDFEKDKQKLSEKFSILNSALNKSPVDSKKAKKEIVEIFKILEKNLGDFDENDFSRDDFK